jgi:hypothetical protein
MRDSTSTPNYLHYSYPLIFIEYLLFLITILDVTEQKKLVLLLVASASNPAHG